MLKQSIEKSYYFRKSHQEDAILRLKAVDIQFPQRQLPAADAAEGQITPCADWSSMEISR